MQGDPEPCSKPLVDIHLKLCFNRKTLYQNATFTSMSIGDLEQGVGSPCRPTRMRRVKATICHDGYQIYASENLSLEGEPSPLRLGLVDFDFCYSTNFAWADESTAEWTKKWNKRGGTPKSKSTLPRSET